MLKRYSRYQITQIFILIVGFVGMIFVISNYNEIESNVYSETNIKLSQESKVQNINIPMVSSVEQLRKENINVGTTIRTKGYYEGSEYGGAEYQIIANYSGYEDGLHILLDNGYWAEMKVINGIINVSSFGAYGDGIHDDTNPVQQALSSGYKVKCEKDAVYLLSKGLMIPSKSILQGNGATFLIEEIKTFFYDETNQQENNGKGLFYYQFFMPVDYDGENELFEWKNISISWNVEQRMNHVNTYYIFMFNHVKKISITGLNIIVNGNEANCIQPIKFNGSSDYVRLNKCDIRNYTHAYMGSCLWFNVGEGGYPDFVMSESYFYSEAKDEVLSVWGRYGENITFNNCTIEKNNVACYGADGKRKDNKSDVLIVSKASKRQINDQKGINTHLVTYNNCDFISTGESTHFFATNSYYGEKMITEFNNCNIAGQSEVSFITAENTSDQIDGMTNIENKQEFAESLKVYFNQCNITWYTSTLATTHAPNFGFTDCNIIVNKHLIDLTWPSNRLINCWTGEFSNNTITINNADGVFVNISDNYCLDIICRENNIKVEENSLKNNILTKQNYDIRQCEVRHRRGAECQYFIYNNTIS